MKKIAILIPVFNGLHYLKRSLPSICKQIREIEEWQFTIIITDDNSTDGTSSWLSHNYPEIVVLNGSGSLWWSGGINKGVTYALSCKDFEFVLLWNHDTICAEDYFQQLIRKVPEIASNTIVASKVFFQHKPDVIFNMGAFFNPKTGVRTLYGYNQIDTKEYNKPISVDWTGGMGTLIPIEIFSRIGLFDEKNFPQYYGDADFFLRAKENGYKILVFSELKIWNDKSSSGLEHQESWSLFINSLFSLKSNSNVFIEYRFLKKHCHTFWWRFHFFVRIMKYFLFFVKCWMQSLFRKS